MQSSLTVTGLAAALAATTEQVRTCGADTASGGNLYPGSAAMSLISADRREAVSSLHLLSPVPLFVTAASLFMARVSCTHTSVQKAKFNFAGITEKSETAPAI